MVYIDELHAKLKDSEEEIGKGWEMVENLEKYELQERYSERWLPFYCIAEFDHRLRLRHQHRSGCSDPDC